MAVGEDSDSSKWSKFIRISINKYINITLKHKYLPKNSHYCYIVVIEPNIQMRLILQLNFSMNINYNLAKIQGKFKFVIVICC